ncbi:MAG: serine/threonine protein kinase [Gammaproteobacteria bacterium]|nr:serine/threonine protein kinase [Gammaproteobacteria bacterium]MYF39174.1 serine/threonine protein kinase [Gammaproteobacteria bacterium]
MLYPKHPDAYPVVYRPETDIHLPRKPDNRMRYMYFKTIAKGGTCIISSCRDLHLRRTICHKALRKEIQDDPVEQARFLREARVTAMLQHPNTIPTYELGRDAKGHYYFTMKLVHGVTLREVLDQCKSKKTHNVGKFDLFRLVDVLSQVAHCLHYAHTHGVVHRDIKPENVLVGDFDEVMVLDWGMAKVWDDDGRVNTLPEDLDPHWKLQKIDAADESIPLTRRAPVQGTPPYMSPEQLENPHDVDHRTDVYSLGTLIFEVLTLKRMIEGDDVLTVIENIKNKAQPHPSKRAPSMNVPDALERICLTCTNFDREQRYNSLETVIDELEQWMRPD